MCILAQLCLHSPWLGPVTAGWWFARRRRRSAGRASPVQRPPLHHTCPGNSPPVRTSNQTCATKTQFIKVKTPSKYHNNSVPQVNKICSMECDICINWGHPIILFSLLQKRAIEKNLQEQQIFPKLFPAITLVAYLFRIATIALASLASPGTVLRKYG